MLDTNVVSELVKPKPDGVVLAWLGRQPLAQTYLSAITIGEIEQGIGRLGATKRASVYRRWLDEDVRTNFAGRVLPLDETVMVNWGRITAKAVVAGRVPTLLDSLIAAVAITHDLVLVTRNTRHVAMLPVEVFDPWQA